MPQFTGRTSPQRGMSIFAITSSAADLAVHLRMARAAGLGFALGAFAKLASDWWSP